MKPSFLTVLSILGLALGLYAGCSKDAEPAPIEDACEGIIDACHTKDDGSVESINACHSLAHDGVDADCRDQYEECVALCDEAPEVGTYAEDSGDDHHGEGDAGNDDSSNASCAELGSGCHDLPGPIPQMCHDVGHDGDETACVAVWVECAEACGL